jgi:hypothetical protein
VPRDNCVTEANSTRLVLVKGIQAEDDSRTGREIHMTRKLIIAVACVAGLVAPAYAETWKMSVVLIPEKSSSSCNPTAPAGVSWEMKSEAGKLTGQSNQGSSFDTNVGADGVVSTNYRGKLGNESFPMQLTGNVNSKQFELYNFKYSCRYRLVPM